MNKLREKLAAFFQGRHGMDELGKVLLAVHMILYFVGAVLKNGVLLSLSLLGLICFIYRAMSRQEWDRNEENRRFNLYIKYLKIQFQERKISRIYICKRCGRMVRVPKGKGKIQVTCPSCGEKKICRT